MVGMHKMGAFFVISYRSIYNTEDLGQIYRTIFALNLGKFILFVY